MSAPGRPGNEPIPSAVVILYRRGEVGAEVFWVRRGSDTRFSAGFYAFCGGRMDQADATIGVTGAEGFEAAIRVAAVRELFEEAGVLVARGVERLGASRLAAHRRALVESRTSFAQILAEEQLALDAADLSDAGRWITPSFLPLRYDARLFLVELPEGQTAEAWPEHGELAEGAFVRPAAALDRWAEGTALLHPPNLHALRVMSKFDRLEVALDALRQQPDATDHIARRIEFQRGIRLVPLRTPALPPATHTGCYVLGELELAVVDPGAPSEEEQAKLFRLLDTLVAEGRRVVAVVPTHHHLDHVGALKPVVRRYRAPVWAHAATASALSVATSRTLADGEEIVLRGDPEMRFRAVHTPGHAAGHLCLFEPRSRALLAGDMVSSVSTVIVDPPEGDMAAYVASLEKLRALEPSAIYPAHGPVIADGKRKLDEYLAHRRERESLVVQALQAGARSLAHVVEKAYADTDPSMHTLAERSALAILLKLEAEGRVRRCGDEFGLA